MIIVPFFFFSCEKDIELQEGHYTLEVNGRYSLNGVDYEDYNRISYMQLSKVGTDTYEIYELCEGEIASPKSLIYVYDDGRVGGEIYLVGGYGSIEGNINENKITGTFKGTYIAFWRGPMAGSDTVPMNGNFLMEYHYEYPQ